MSQVKNDEQVKYIQKYFDHKIMGYVRQDIISLLEKTKPNEEGYGGCAVPLAMTVFSAMNLLGYLTMTRDKVNLKTERYIKEFCKDWMTEADKEVYSKETNAEILTVLYRHPIAHQFMPEIGGAITRNPKFQNVISRLKDGSYVLQAEILANHFLKAIESLSKRIKAGKNIDLITRFYKRLNKEMRDNKDKLEELFAKVERNVDLPTIDVNEFDVTVSGTKMPPADTSVTA